MSKIVNHPDGTIQWEKCERRTADKLHHFERWAVKVTKEIPQESRLSFMRAQLLEGPIGEHALLHLRFLDDLSLDRRSGYAKHYPLDRRSGYGQPSRVLGAPLDVGETPFERLGRNAGQNGDSIRNSNLGF